MFRFFIARGTAAYTHGGMAPPRYFVKDGYRSRRRPRHYQDSLEDSRRYQVMVYEHAARIASQPHVHSVLDIGCGLGTKLIDHIKPHSQTTGLDTAGSVEQCRKRFPDAEWIAADLSKRKTRLDRTFDLIISADVIEHLRNPDLLLNLARQSSHERTVVVLSTPDRDLRRGTEDMGPPGNPAHVREWNQVEFAAYLSSHDFRVAETAVVDTRPGLRTCQMVTGAFASVG